VEGSHLEYQKIIKNQELENKRKTSGQTPQLHNWSTGHGLIDASKGTILGWYINDLVSRPERGAITPVGIHPEPKGHS